MTVLLCPKCEAEAAGFEVVTGAEVAADYERAAYEAQRESGYCENCRCGFHTAECGNCGECDYTMRLHPHVHDALCGQLTCAGSDAVREGRTR